MKKLLYTALIATTVLGFSAKVFAEGPRMDQRAQMQGDYYSTIQPAMGTPNKVVWLNRGQVRDIQEALGTHGYRPGPLDGILGRKTAEALRAFQADNGMPATGEVTGETLSELGFNTTPMMQGQSRQDRMMQERSEAMREMRMKHMNNEQYEGDYNKMRTRQGY